MVQTHTQRIDRTTRTTKNHQTKRVAWNTANGAANSLKAALSGMLQGSQENPTILAYDT